MINTAIITPLLAQIGLTFVIMIYMALRRIQVTSTRQVKIRDIALNSRNYPDDVLKIGNNYVNQFELPILFYLLCLLLVNSGQGDNSVQLILAWVFVGARIVHAFIHVTSNHVPLRFYAFLVSAITLVAMWGLFAFEHFGS